MEVRKKINFLDIKKTMRSKLEESSQALKVSKNSDMYKAKIEEIKIIKRDKPTFPYSLNMKSIF